MRFLMTMAVLLVATPVLAKDAARATGDKPTASEVVRAGLLLLAALSPAERLAAIGKVPKVR